MDSKTDDDKKSNSDTSETNEELEYSVQFGGRVPSEEKNSDSEDEISTTDKVVIETDSMRDKEPVVFVVGWAGCLDKHLTKYSEMYVKAGVTAIRFKPKFRRYFLTVEDMSLLRKQAEKFIEIVSDLGLENHPIFFHVFSNNGVAFYSEVVDIILNQNASSDSLLVCGAILDSCPGKPRCITLARYTLQSSQIDQLTPFQTFLRLVCAFFFAILSPLTKVLFGWQTMTRLANRDRIEHWPVYYVYSDSDKLVPFRDVEASIRFRSGNGLPVGSHRFIDSVHVAHYKKYPEHYANHCLTFMKNCLSQ